MERKSAQQKPGEAVLRIGAALSVVIAISGLVEIYQLYDRVYFNKGILSAAVFAAALAAADRMQKDMEADRRASRAAYGLAALLIAGELVGIGLRLRTNSVEAALCGPAVLWMAGSALALAVPAEPFFFRVMNWRICSDEEEESRLTLNQLFWWAWLAVFVGYIPCYLAFYPGLYCYDMIWQWSMFNSGVFNTHHPLVHTLLGGWLLETGRKLSGTYNGGLALYSGIQMAVLSGCIAFALRYLAKIRIRRRLWIGALLFYILFPFFPVLGISTTKDVIFGGLLLVVFVCLCDMVTLGAVYRGRKLALFLVVSVLMGMFRNNAMYALAFTVVCFLAVSGFMLFKRKKSRFLLQITALLLGTIAGILVMQKTLEKGLDAEAGSVAEMLSIPCQQLARTYVFYGEKLSPADREELFLYIPEQALDGYLYYVSDPVKAELNVDYLRQHKMDFLRLWLRIGRQFPGSYLQATLYNTMGIWYMGGDSSCFMEYNMSQPIDEAHRVEFDSKLPPLKAAYSWFTDKNIQKSLPMASILFYTSFYSWAVLICMAVLVQRRRYLHLIPAAVLLGYIVSLVPGPCITVRYMLGIMLCVPVLAAFTFREKRCPKIPPAA